MALKQIPTKFEFTCDGCGKVETMDRNSPPKYWSVFIIKRDTYDFQGYAVADASVERALCRDCGDIVASAVNKVCADRAGTGVK